MNSGLGGRSQKLGMQTTNISFLFSTLDILRKQLLSLDERMSML